MEYIIKTFQGSDADFEKLKQYLDVSSAIMEDYFNDPYEEIVRSKCYGDQQIAGALIVLAYQVLRVQRPAKKSSDILDLLSQCVKERVEEGIKLSGVDPYLKRLS